MKVSRRDFLQSASTAIGAALLDRKSSPDELEKTIKEIRANLFEMINEEREVEKVPTVELDELATEVATKHALDMVRGAFASHWGRDGFKPYHRYSFAGGTDSTAENISAADNTWSTKSDALKLDTAYLHVRLYQEKPPNDGHRKTILAPHYTHVGLGIAVYELRLRLVELFVSRHVDVRPIVREWKPGDSVIIAGKIRKGYGLNYVEVFYEPLPLARDVNWLNSTRSYSLPNESMILRPKAPPPFKYADGVEGVVDFFDDGGFLAPIKLYKNEPGIYTIVAWISGARSVEPFQATNVCVKAL